MRNRCEIDAELARERCEISVKLVCNDAKSLLNHCEIVVKIAVKSSPPPQPPYRPQGGLIGTYNQTCSNNNRK